MKHDIDTFLRCNLSADIEPEENLNKQILDFAKKEQTMRKSWIRRSPAVAMAAAVIIVFGSVTGYAAWHLLSPSDIAVEIGDEPLSKAFASEDAVLVNKTISQNGFDITMLGVVSGSRLAKYGMEIDGELKDDRTYCAIALKSSEKNGGNVEEKWEDIMVTPFIKGEEPWSMNIFYMGGGRTCCKYEGVRYFLTDCANLEVFSKRGVYLAVTDDKFIGNEPYKMDKESGEIKSNPEYTGINALFELPLDISKADEKAADKLLKEWRGDASDENTNETEESDNTNSKADRKNYEEDIYLSNNTQDYASWTCEEVYKNCGTDIFEAVLKVDEDGYLNIPKWEYNDSSYDSGMILASEIFEKNDKAGSSKILSIIEMSPNTFFEIITKNDDDTFTFKVYKLND